MNAFGPVRRTTLSNGLEFLVHKDTKVPKVSVQLWYNVGSKHEVAGQKGLAHLLEHMIFKGTQRLSESDINLITQKLSGYTNAFTSYDYTGYLFDFPKNHWKESLGMLSDCMVNCTFPEEMLQSELKAVIQELKMYKDDYSASLFEAMTTAMFSDHPYHYPIIGYKQDLWGITRENLYAFYKKYYAPNNATLVIVGDINEMEVTKEVSNYFENILPRPCEQISIRSAQRDMQARSTYLYRDVQRPLVTYAWRVPGASEGYTAALDVLSYIIGQSEQSKLYKKLVDELQLATNVGMFYDDLFQHGILFLCIDPINEAVIDEIKALVQDFISDFFKNIPDEEYVAALNQARMAHLIQVESFQERAYMIAKGFLATGDQEYARTLFSGDVDVYKKQIQALGNHYVRSALMHEGYVLSLPEAEKQQWLRVQKEQDDADAVILSRKVRGSVVEPGRLVHSVQAQRPNAPVVPQYEKLVLSNGCAVYACKTFDQKIEIICDIDMHNVQEPAGLEGIGYLMFQMLKEGTRKFSKNRLMLELARRGMYMDIQRGSIALTLFKQDLAFAVSLLESLLLHALFDKDALQKVRSQILSEIDDFWDDPHRIIKQRAREHVYQGHPYKDMFLGTKRSIANITRNDLIDFYGLCMRPEAIAIAVVGDFDQEFLMQYVSGIFKDVPQIAVPLLDYPTLSHVKKQEIMHPIARDQVTLAFAGLSVDRKDLRYDALLVFDQIFTGGVTGSMSSRLFQLREQTGLFYTIGGSSVFGAGRQPGMFFIKTIVSQDRVDEAVAAISGVIQNALHGIEEQELRAAKDALVHAMTDRLSTQKALAQSLLYLHRMKLDCNFYANRVQEIEHVRKDDLMSAVPTILNVDLLSVIKVGRF